MTTASVSTPSSQNDETQRLFFNLKMVGLLLLLPLILFAVFLKHLLDYLFGLAEKEKDVIGKVALVSLEIWGSSDVILSSAQYFFLFFQLNLGFPLNGH